MSADRVLQQGLIVVEAVTAEVAAVGMSSEMHILATASSGSGTVDSQIRSWERPVAAAAVAVVVVRETDSGLAGH